MHSLRDYLKEWADADVAMYYIGCCLSLFPPPATDMAGFRAVKGVLWSSNEVADTLELVSKRLVRNGALLFDEGEQRYRWNESYTMEKAI